MKGKVDQILLPNAPEYFVAVDEFANKHVLPDLSFINFFVGPNNSGKSRLLRALAQERWSARPAFYPSEGKLLKDKLISVFRHAESFSDQLPGIFKVWEIIDFYPGYGSPIDAANSLYSSVIGLARRAMEQGKELGRMTLSELKMPVKILIEYAGSQSLAEFGQSTGSFRRLYLPVLRGLRPFATGPSKQEDHYASRTKADYFAMGSTAEIYTGQTFYSDFRSLLLGDHQMRETARSFESFLSTELFGGEPVTIIPRENSDVIYLKIGDAEEREIHHVGDGLQQLIALTFPLFKNQEVESYVFVEEPEIFLHPGMQRALIKAMRKFRGNQYFIATHSNHLLDLTLEFDDISIYSVNPAKPNPAPEDQGRFEITVSTSHDFRILESLGARSSSVFLSNCTLWVEGITDRRYLGHFLKLYVDFLKAKATEKEESLPFIPKQDLHYSFVEYSGGNITHWSVMESEEETIDVERLCSKLFLVADRDHGKEARHEKLLRALGGRFHCLACREIENLLTPEVLKRVLESYGEDLAAIKPFQQESYAEKYLGTFLNGIIKPSPKRTGGYTEGSTAVADSAKRKRGSGTIKSKTDFCKRALDAMNPERVEGGYEPYTFDDLSVEARALTKKLYEFVKAQNA